MFDCDLNPAAPASAVPASAVQGALAQRDEVHVLLLAARNSRSALLAVEDALAVSDAELCRLSLKPVGRIIEASVKLRGLDAAGAERLAARASRQLGVSSARVEHVWGLK